MLMKNMKLYLLGRRCQRGVFGQFLDGSDDRWWCLASDEVCGVCVEAHAEARPKGFHFTLLAAAAVAAVAPTGTRVAALRRPSCFGVGAGKGNERQLGLAYPSPAVKLAQIRRGNTKSHAHGL